MYSIPLSDVHRTANAVRTRRCGRMVPDHFGRPAEEYEALRTTAGLFDQSYRGLIEVTGRDRHAWLANLVTNVITTLQPGEGNYAFALNAKGRVLFDCNLLVTTEAIWLDADLSAILPALEHLNHYLIGEGVSLTDRSAGFARMALLGPNAARMLEALGIGSATAMAQLQHGSVVLAGKPRVFARNDGLAGVFAAEFWVDTEDGQACWRELLDVGAPFGVRPVGLAAVQAVRIEAGIPWFGDDIDEQVVAPETLQNERAISRAKGCYLGHEVVERMRTRGVMARKLIGVTIEGGVLPAPPATIRIDGVDTGRLTSVCRSPGSGRGIGLGYFKTTLARAGVPIVVQWPGGRAGGRLSDVPVR